MTLPQELPGATEIICEPAILKSEVPFYLRQGLVSNGKEYGFVGVMPLCDDGAVIKFKTQRLRDYGEYTLTRFLGFLPDPFGENSYLENVKRHKMVGFGHNGDKDEVVFIMGETNDKRFYVIELINGNRYFAFILNSPTDYPYYPK